MRPAHLPSLFLLLLFSVAAQAQYTKINPPADAPNRIENAARKSDLQQTPLSHIIDHTTSTSNWQIKLTSDVMPVITTPAARAIKDEKALHKYYTSTSTPPVARAVTPVIDRSFEANLSIEETPSSNSIAVSNAGIIISVNSDDIIYFRDDGTRLYEATWSDFYDDSQLTASFFSPRVLYDSEEDRFILVTLHGRTPATSRVIIAFSRSANPMDGWNDYKLPGNPLGDGSWFDFASIGISTNEVYVSGNLIEGTTFKKAIIYQINKTDGYVAAVLDWQFWTDFFNGPVSITPASFGQQGDYGPGIYLISSAAAGDNDYWFWDLTNDIGQGEELIGYIVPSETYGPPADASQAGSSDKLDSGDSRTISAFYLDGIIHFVLNVDVGGGFSGISYNRFSVPLQTVTTTRLGEPGNADLAHSGVASFATSMSDRSVMITFLRSGAAIFPEFRVVNVDQGMQWSTATLVKAGETFVDRAGAVEPWGQYTGIARRHNSPDPRTWSSGSVGANIPGQVDHSYKSQIGEVTNGTMVNTVDLTRMESFDVNPNPVVDLMEVKFDVTSSQLITIAIHDMQGQLIKVLYRDTPRIGEHNLTFNKGALIPGTYVLSIASPSQVLANEKIIIAD